MNNTLATLERGLAGCFGEYLPTAVGEGIGAGTSKCSVSGIYGRASIIDYLGRLCDGGLVIDKAAVLERNPMLALRSPMLDTALPDNGFKKFDGAGSMVLEAFSYGNSTQRGLAALATSAPDSTAAIPGPCDYVGIAAYARWWASHKARIGRKQGTTVVWDDGEGERSTETFEALAERWSPHF